MENSWVMFDHVKRLKERMTMVRHSYNNKYCRGLMSHQIWPHWEVVETRRGMAQASDEALVHNATRGQLGFLIASRGSSCRVGRCVECGYSWAQHPGQMWTTNNAHNDIRFYAN